MGKLEYKVPTLAPGPVKKEIMQCLRDIALDEQNIRYYEYSDGIITGCKLYEENMKIGLVNGIIKFGGRLYKLMEKASVPYEPTDDWTVLKVRFSPQVQHREYTIFTAELVLDVNTEIRPNELEMGRFKLKHGSYLRTEYKDFWDMGTEYDTVNLLHVRQAARVAATLCPEITMHFAREAYRHCQDNAMDMAFCSICLATGEAVSREVIQRYVCARNGQEYKEMDNGGLHRSLAEILDKITGRDRRDKGRGKAAGVMVIN